MRDGWMTLVFFLENKTSCAIFVGSGLKDYCHCFIHLFLFSRSLFTFAVVSLTFSTTESKDVSSAKSLAEQRSWKGRRSQKGRRSWKEGAERSSKALREPYFKKRVTIKSVIYLVSDRYKLLDRRITRDKIWLMWWKKIVFYKIIMQAVENETFKYLTTDWEQRNWFIIFN